jgi:CPA2 family monovalent cation:H+ antiporter-2
VPGVPLLRELVILVAVAIPVVIVTHRLKTPAVVGFLLTGMAIGPHGLGLIGRGEAVAALAEMGAVLLLFVVGLELSLSRVMRLGREVAQGGGLQVLVTLLLVAVLAAAFGVPARRAVFFGSLVALSSTAIVLKVYAERGELDTPHGRVVVGILLFQDLCVVPFMVLAPILAGTATGAGAALRAVAASLVVVGVLVLGGRLAAPWLLARVVGLRNRELFTLAVLCLGLGAAYLTSSFGLSLALGAFLAGLVIAESEYGLQALSDVLPFRDAFGGIFFTAVGMLLDLGSAAGRPLAVLGAAAGVVALKAVVAGAVVRSLGRSVDVSAVAGLGLAQVGEFSFVLAGAGLPLGLFGAGEYQLFLAASVLSMLAAPFAITASRPAAQRLCRLAGQPAVEILPHQEPAVASLSDHVIIVGYGLNGRNLARALARARITFVVLEQNGPVVQQARAAGVNIYFGDGTRPEVLDRVGIARARVLVYAIAAADDERRGVAAARRLNPRVRIVVRTRYVREVEELRRLGADEVVPEEFETSLEIFARVLRRYAVPASRIRREVDAVRSAHYEMLRTEAAGMRLLDALPASVSVDLETVRVELGAPAVGENAVTMRFRTTTGASVIAVIRDGTALYEPDPAFRFRPGDEVVLVGTPEALEKGEPLFRGA